MSRFLSRKPGAPKPVEGAPARSEAQRPGRVCLTIHTTADLPRVLDPVAEGMTRLGFPDKEVFGVRLALEEALVNGLRHGNRGDPGKRVRVRYRLTPEEVWAEVEDQGQGFDPAGVADPTTEQGWSRPGGRGLLLMRHYLSSVRHNERGNAVTLCQRRRREAAGISEP